MRTYIDCTSTHTSGLNTGIQRVVRNYVRHATDLAPLMGVTCYPVVVSGGSLMALPSVDDLFVRRRSRTFRDMLNSAYARVVHRIAALVPIPRLQSFLLAHRSQFGLAWLLFLPVSMYARMCARFSSQSPAPLRLEHTFTQGDVFFMPDASWFDVSEKVLTGAKEQGVLIVFFIHDIIPLTHPQFFSSTHGDHFRVWFSSILRFADLLIYNSRFTQQTVIDYVSTQSDCPLPPGAVVYLGCDLSPLPIRTFRHAGLRAVFCRDTRICLVVGTIEPRKNLDLVINAFEHLWGCDENVSLLLIGRVGWLCDDLLDRIRRHPQLNQRLFWFDDVDDADLALTYHRASTLIFPSVVEGFGLPLVEALNSGLPVIASDIPVFREIAGDHARFFPASDASALVDAVREVLSGAPTGEGQQQRWLTWKESTRQLLAVLKAFSESRMITK